MIRSMLAIFAVLASISAHSQTAAAPLQKVVAIESGKISGLVSDGVYTFKGIPYAAPPVAELRWRSPQQVASWSGTRSCENFASICPQNWYPTGSFYWSEPQTQNEDCLYLNVWTAAKEDDEKRPVMVWIHGGAWTKGASSMPRYNGRSLARRGVVVVTINYRLGALGFFSHPELSQESRLDASGNQGILDQIAALKWVQRNISKFGGDPDRVTIFGESAGSWSVNALVATPLAKGLFHRAIGQSGSRFRRETYLRSDPDQRKTAEQEGLVFAESLGAASLAELRSLPVSKLLQTRFATHETVDGWVFPDSISKIYEAGKHNHVPVIVGSNADEMTTLSSPNAVPKTLDAVSAAISRRYGTSSWSVFRSVYGVDDDASAATAFLASGSDGLFAVGMRQWARYASRAGGDAYLYYFTRAPRAKDGMQRGAYHGAEIPYAFDNTANSDRFDYDPPDRRLADTIASYWVNFARTGNPNAEGLPNWPKYDETDEHYVELGDQISAKQHLLEARLDFLEKAQSRE